MMEACQNGDMERTEPLNIQRKTLEYLTYPHAVHSLVKEQAAKQYCLETTIDDMEAPEHLLDYDDRTYMIDEAIVTDQEPEALNLADGQFARPAHHYTDIQEFPSMIADRDRRYPIAKQIAETIAKSRQQRTKLKLKQRREPTTVAEKNGEREPKKLRTNEYRNPTEPDTALELMLADDAHLLQCRPPRRSSSS